MEIFQHFTAVAGLPVDFGGGHATRLKAGQELLRRGDQRQEHHRFPVRVLRGQNIRDLFQVRVKGVCNIPQLEIPFRLPNAGKVDVQRDGLHLQRGKVAFPNRTNQAVFVGHRFKQFPQVDFIPAVGGGGHAQHTRIGEVIQHPPVRRGNGMVRFIHHNVRELIFGKCRQPVEVLQGLNASHDYGKKPVNGMAFRLFQPCHNARGTDQLIRRLLQQFFPVCQDEHAPPCQHHAPDYFRKNDGFSGSGGKHQQGFAYSFLPLVQDCFHGFRLVRPKFH